METEGRTLLRTAAMWLLPVVLFVFIFTTSSSLVINNATRIKEIVSDSGLYNSLMDAVLAQTSETSSGTVIGKLPIEQSDIQAVIHEAFPLSTLALQGNQVIDGTYAWLRGETNQPTFSIDLSEGKKQLATGLAAHTQQKLSTLPLCPDMASAAAFEPFSATCRPAGLDIAATAQTLEQQVMSSTEFLANPVITANTLTNDQDQTISETSSRLPQAYQRLLGLPVVTAVLAVIFIVLSLLASEDRQRQYKRLSSVIICTGVFAIAISFVAGKGWQVASSTFIETAFDKHPLLLEHFIKIIRSIGTAITYESIMISLIVIGMGLLVGIIGRTASRSGVPMGRLLTPAPSPDAQKIPLTPPKG